MAIMKAMPDPKDRLRELRIDREATAGVNRRPALLATAAGLVIAAAVVGWWLSGPASATVRTVPVTSGTGDGGVADTGVLDASGYVTARLQATISSKVTGKIVEVLVEEGMTVQQGDVLARLDGATVERQVEVAEAQVASARSSLDELRVRLAEGKINLRRTQGLVAANARSQSELDADQAAADALQARLVVGERDLVVAESLVALRRQELEDRIIRAPFDGVVVAKNAQPGEMISPVSAGGGFTRTGICTLVDMTSLEIEVDVNEAYINRVERGQKVRATLDAYPEWKIPATVITPVPTADRQKATVRVRIGFDALDPRVLPGSAPGAGPARALMPSAALRDDAGQPVVFVYAGGSLERRAVRLGSRRRGQVEIVAGLRIGEQVVVEGPDDLADGDRVVTR